MTFMAFPSQISSEIKRGLNAIATQQQNTAACRTEDVDSGRARHSPGSLFVCSPDLIVTSYAVDDDDDHGDSWRS